MSTQLSAPAKPSNAFSPEEAEAFMMKAFTDLGGGITALIVALGDRYGLFKDLATHGPHTAAEIANCSAVNERYALEWASCLSAAEYLTYDPASKKFALPPAHAAVLADEGGPFFLPGFHQQVIAMAKVFEPVATVFRDGGGVPSEAYDNDMWEGQDRATSMWHDSLLVNQWVPLFPNVQRKLEQGADVADIGCGSGRAMVRLAQAFPKSRFTGFDLHGPSVDRARALAREAGVDDRVKFEVADVTQGLPGRFDLITAFDVVHDTADPPATFRGIHRSLKKGGSFLLLEINTADNLEDNTGAFASAFYGVSVFYCMTIALSKGGLGYGTAGLPEGRVRKEAAAAGFTAVNKVDINNPLNNLYELCA